MKLSLIYFISIVAALSPIKREDSCENCANLGQRIIKPCFEFFADWEKFSNCLCKNNEYWDGIKNCKKNCDGWEAPEFNMQEMEEACEKVGGGVGGATVTPTGKYSFESTSTDKKTTTKEETSTQTSTSTSTSEKTSESTTKGLASGMTLGSMVYLVVLGMI